MPRIAANGKVNDALYLYNQEYWEICNLDISNTVDGCKMVAGDTNPTGNVTARDNSEGEKLGDYPAAYTLQAAMFRACRASTSTMSAYMMFPAL